MDVEREHQRTDAKILLVKWTSNASQTATVDIGNCFGYKVNRVQCVPGLNGDLTTDLPSADYDVTITDEFGEDIMIGELVDLSGTAATSRFAYNPVSVIGTLTLNVSNAGISKSGLVNVYMEIDT